MAARADGFVLTGLVTGGAVDGVDAFLLSVGLDGAAQWMRTFGGALDERGAGLAWAADGGLAMAGDTMSSGAGGYDGWLVKTAADGSSPCASVLVPPGSVKSTAVAPDSLTFTPEMLSAGKAGSDTTVQGSVLVEQAVTSLCACQ